MKCTLKIDFQQINTQGIPVIKIIQPESIMNPNQYDDVDPKDTLLKNFLHSPYSLERHKLFKLETYFPVTFENPTHYITTIAPITHEEMLKDLKYMVQNQFKNEILSGEQSDKIDEFFSWLKKETQE